MKLYDSMKQDLATLTLSKDPITVYVCGITPYDTTHLGHAFSYTSVDVLIRYLETKGQRVRYVQNVTDIDDDILRKAKELGEDWRAVGNRWTRHFIEDMVTLNVRPPDAYPRATDVIEQIIDRVNDLLEAGVAYARAGSVYFDIQKWPNYGRLSRIPRDRMLPIANERGNFPDDPNKKDPLDFVLWQAQAPGEPAWESPWGPGRPGWHIECSTLASVLLGETVDIHSGGADLIFPHHESEIVQVEPLTGGLAFVRTWMHVAMVRHEGEKMSKSLGNLVMIRDLLQQWSPDTLRLYLGRHHYRDSWSHDLEELEEATALARKLLQASASPSGTDGTLDPTPAFEAFNKSLDNDLSTPAALASLEDLADSILMRAEGKRDVSQAQEALRFMGKVFGLRLSALEPDPDVAAGWQTHLERFSGVEPGSP